MCTYSCDDTPTPERSTTEKLVFCLSFCFFLVRGSGRRHPFSLFDHTLDFHHWCRCTGGGLGGWVGVSLSSLFSSLLSQNRRQCVFFRF